MSTLRPNLLLLGVMLGVAAGLLAGWVVFPALAAGTLPAQLSADHREAQMIMIAMALRADNNVERRCAPSSRAATCSKAAQASPR